MNSAHRQQTSPKYKNKNEKKTVSPLIISKSLLNQSGVNSPSESFDNEKD